MLLMQELTHGELKDWADFRPSFLPFGKAGGRRIPRWKGFAVDCYGGTLSALTPAPSDFCNDGVYNIKEELLNREWAHFGNKGLKLKEPENLLQAWCMEYQTENKPHLSLYSLLTPSKFEARLLMVCSELRVRYALSGLSGAFRLAPFVRYHRVSFYLEDKANEFVKAMGLKSVTSGENVYIMKPLDDGVFYDARHIGELSVVSPIQLYLDLYLLGDRGKEAADHIFQEVIKPQWKKKK